MIIDLNICNLCNKPLEVKGGFKECDNCMIERVYLTLICLNAAYLSIKYKDVYHTFYIKSTKIECFVVGESSLRYLITDLNLVNLILNNAHKDPNKYLTKLLDLTLFK